MDQGKPLPRSPRRCDYQPTRWCRARRQQNPPFHPFEPDAAARLRFPFGNADRLASALRGQGSWQCHRYCHKRCVALPSPFRAKRRQWRISIRRNWSWFRRKISYQAFERAVHTAFESGMACVFRKCRHLTPNTALLVILVAVLWLPISFGAATAMHAILFAKVTSWPAWMQLLHPLATVIAKSKLLELPAYPAAWPQAKRHPLVQLLSKAYEPLKRL